MKKEDKLSEEEKTEIEKKNIEEIMAELEEIAEKMETDLPLEESIKLFKKGVMLSSVCNKKLEEAEKQIKKLVVKDGEVVGEEEFGI